MCVIIDGRLTVLRGKCLDRIIRYTHLERERGWRGVGAGRREGDVIARAIILKVRVNNWMSGSAERMFEWNHAICFILNTSSSHTSRHTHTHTHTHTRTHARTHARTHTHTHTHTQRV